MSVGAPASGELTSALAAWRAALGEEHVLEASAAARYAVDTSRLARHIPAAIRPADADQVAEAVRIAARHRVPIYPVSTGRNWGYGTANPAADGCVVLDLSRMRRIEVDEALGVATVEPGVTQRDLHDWLDARGLPFLVPVTGAGPDGSLVGNALERGYGITPIADHFQAVTAVEAVLPDGERYRTPLSAMGATRADRAYKWGIGPYLDGLFAQGAFGVVTSLSIALARRPERTVGFYFWLAKDEDLEAAVVAVREVLRRLPGVVGGINLMNDVRILAMSVDYPEGQVRPGATLTRAQIASLSRGLEVGPWTGAGAIYGTREIAAAAKTVVRRLLRPVVRRLVFVERTWLQRARRLIAFLPTSLSARLDLTASKVAGSLDLMAGQPTGIALPLAYWRAHRRPESGAPIDPARDGCGLLWYPPLVPIDPATVRAFVGMAKRVCAAHGMEAPITLTSQSERCFDSTVPILFRRDDPDSAARADACWRSLFDEGRRLGLLPYRVGSGQMDGVVDPTLPYWRTVAALRSALDPASIVSPGRYGGPDVRAPRRSR